MGNNRRVNIKTKVKAFTLMELLVSIGILSVLFAIIFPVYRSAVDSAKRAVCVEHYRQIAGALMMYTSDYDQSVPPVNYTLVRYNDSGSDRSWVQLLLPYVGKLELFICPSDIGRVSEIAGETTQYKDSVDAWVIYYQESLKSNLGYNYLYFSPLLKFENSDWLAFPVKTSQVVNPSGTIVFIDSLWDRTVNGNPIGGGSWAVVPPCRYMISSMSVYDTFNFPQGVKSYFGFDPEGWEHENSNSWQVYGGAWPWHRGKFNIVYLDGRVKSVNVNNLIEGCEFQPYWQGNIYSLEEYQWDIAE